MGAIASQTTSFTIVYSIVYSHADKRKYQSSASLAFVRGIHRGPVNSPHKWPVTRKMFPFDDVIMITDALLKESTDDRWIRLTKCQRYGKQRHVIHHSQCRLNSVIACLGKNAINHTIADCQRIIKSTFVAADDIVETSFHHMHATYVFDRREHGQ